MKKFLLSGALLLCSILSAFAQFSGSGSGTENDPYLISNAYQLNQMRNFLNKDSVYFHLMSDIDLADWLSYNSPSDGWLPIGTESSSFKGFFDGNNHTISNMSIRRSNTDNVGLFGYTINATITNITVKGDITGHNDVGGIVGTCRGLDYLIGIYYYSDTHFKNCHYEGTVSGNENVGGIVGWMKKTNAPDMDNCSMQGDINGTKCIGGIVGNMDGYKGNISNLKSTGTVTAIGNNCGGIFGSLLGGYFVMSKCTTKTTIQGNDYVGGIVGYAKEIPFKAISKCSSVIHLKGNNYVGGVLGGNETSTRPTHNYGSGKEDSQYALKENSEYHDNVVIGSTSVMHNNCVIGDIVSQGQYIGGIIGMTYNGCKRGSGRKGNCYYYNGEYVGYYDYNYESHETVHIKVSKTFYDYEVTSLDIDNCSFNGQIQGKESVGGIAGYRNGGETTKSYSNATIIGEDKVGGIIGEIDFLDISASITSCVVTNPIVSASTKNAGRIYGAASGDVAIGANFTQNWYLTSNCVIKNGVRDNGGSSEQMGFQADLEPLKKKATYVEMGWDFNNDWTIQETETFPYKPWQAVQPYITSKLVSQATTISGKSIDGGTVYLQIGDDFTASTRCNGTEWSFTVPALQSGATVKLYVEADDKLQSPYTITLVEFPGSGNGDDPYLIYTAEDLQGIYNKLSYYKLMNDVDLTEWINKNSPTEGWKAIGKSRGADSFCFDGGGHKITGLWTNSDCDYNGLFSRITYGYISNLTIETAPGKKVSGKDYTGILAGYMSGYDTALQDITVSGDVEGTIHTGGIVGFIGYSKVIKDLTYEGCVSSATDKAYIGGLAGLAEDNSTITSCKVTATINASGANAVAGALLGQSDATITECMADGNVIANTQDSTYAGGLIGINKEKGKISDCYANTSVTSSLYTAGLVAYNYGNITNCYAMGNVESKNYGTGLVGYNDGAKASVTKCLAANKQINVTDESGRCFRMLGGFKNGAATPDNDNYALKDMTLSVNGVATKATDNILDGIGKEQSELTNKAFYTNLGWDFVKVWRFEPDKTYPQLTKFGIAGYDKGDVNRDKEINVVDVVDIARFVVGTPSDNFVYLLADMNNDNDVNVADAVSLVNVIAGDVKYKAAAKAMRIVAGDDSLSLTSDGNCLALNLSGSTAFTACQFDLNVPAEMSAATLSSLRGEGHTILYNKLADGRYRIIVMSTSNAVFERGDGTLLTMTMNGDASTAKLTDIHFVTPDGVDHIFDTIRATAVTGIENIDADAHNDGYWYNIQGMKVTSPQHGMYIHNGKKVILK